jgi:hypothetical protein
VILPCYRVSASRFKPKPDDLRTRLRFRKPSAAKWDRFTLNAQPRSLYMLAGPDVFSSFNEPQNPIPAEITDLTGIANEMVGPRTSD